GEPRHRKRRDSGLTAAAEHYVGPAEANRVVAFADRHRGRRARRAGGAEGPARTEFDRDPARGHVGHECSDQGGMYPRRCGTGTTACETLDATLCGTDSGAYPRRRARDIEFSVGLSHSRGSERELREAIGPPKRAPIEPMR